MFALDSSFSLISHIKTFDPDCRNFFAISRPKHNEKESDDEKSNSRKAWEVGHRLLGLVLLALSWYQIQLGLTRYHIIFEEGLFDKGNSDTDLFIFWPVAGTLAAIVAIGFVLRLVAR